MSKLKFPNISQNEDRQIIASWIFNNMIKNLTGEAIKPQVIEKIIPPNVETNYYDVNNELENELLNLETINNIIISGDIYYIKSYIINYVKTVPKIKQNFKLLIKNINYLTPTQKIQLNDTTNRIILFINQIDENYQKIKNQGYTEGFTLENILSKYLTELKNISVEINNYVALNRNDMSAEPLKYINEQNILNNFNDNSSELAENNSENNSEISELAEKDASDLNGLNSEEEEEEEEMPPLESSELTNEAAPDFTTPELKKKLPDNYFNKPIRNVSIENNNIPLAVINPSDIRQFENGNYDQINNNKLVRMALHQGYNFNIGFINYEIENEKNEKNKLLAGKDYIAYKLLSNLKKSDMNIINNDRKGAQKYKEQLSIGIADSQNLIGSGRRIRKR